MDQIQCPGSITVYAYPDPGPHLASFGSGFKGVKKYNFQNISPTNKSKLYGKSQEIRGRHRKVLYFFNPFLCSSTSTQSSFKESGLPKCGSGTQIRIRRKYPDPAGSGPNKLWFYLIPLSALATRWEKRVRGRLALPRPNLLYSVQYSTQNIRCLNK